MSNTLSKILIFASGAAIGSVVTWKIVTDRYSQIIEEELESIKNEILEELEEEDDVEDDIQEEVKPATEDKTTYNNIVEEAGYRNYSNRTPAKQVIPEEEKKEEEIEDMGGPYVISPDDFDEHDDYEVVSLVYYSDKVLTDEDDNIIEDVEGMVGEESLNHFGEYEDDSVFVRNDERKTDYEILLDERRFADVFTRR
jgi:hypothetical protein